MILYTVLHKLIGLKSQKSLASEISGIGVKKVAFQDLSRMFFPKELWNCSTKILTYNTPADLKETRREAI